MTSTTSLLRLTIVAALAGAPVQRSAQAQPGLPSSDSARLAVARQLLAASGAVELMVSAAKVNLPAAQQASPQLPPEFWSRFRDTLAVAAPALVDSVAIVYANAFTLQELQQLTAFYQSPLGRRVRDVQPKLLTESAAIGQRWGARIGAVIGASLGRD